MNNSHTNGVPERVQTAEDRKVAEQLAHESPEGRPAHPEIGKTKARMLLLLVAMLAIIAGVLISIFYQPLTGVFVALLGVILVIFNPLVWVSLMRGQEVDDTRDDVARRGGTRPIARH